MTASLRMVAVSSSLLALMLAVPASFAQQAAIAVPARITAPVDDAVRVTLPGHVHPLATPANDRGLVPDSTSLNRIQIVLKRSDAQEAAVKQLVEDLHNPASPLFHQWLTPAEFGKQFGPSDADIAAISVWLAGKGFTVTKLTPGHQTLEFEGTAGQFRSAFHTEIRQYAVPASARPATGSGLHFSVNANPEVPVALAPVFGGFVALNNFTPKSPIKDMGKVAYNPATGAAKPAWTIGSPSTGYNFLLSPADLAVQYDIAPLYSASPAVNGSGQTIAVINLSNVDAYLYNQYRSLFGLPASPLNVVIDGNDPGVNGINNPDGQNGWATEAYLDVEMTSSVARNATIDLVIAGDTALSSGAYLAAEYAVYGNLAPVISYSITECETGLGSSNQFLSSLWQQAAAQGITVVVAAGDSGSANCDDFDVQSFAVGGQAVNGFASTPYNIAVGGTDFYYSDYAVGGNTLANQIAGYWTETGSNNTPVVSIKSVIPEQPWNDTQFGLDAAAYSGGSNLTYYENNGTNIVAGSGGASNCGIPTNVCAPYAKPSWQTGTGVPADGVRDLPDVSLFAANGYNYVYYPFCAADGDCQPVAAGSTVQVSGGGGTSASAPVFAGLMALITQKYGRQGQANYVLYPLAQQYPAAFHDIAVGTNTVPCNITTTSDGNKPLNCIAVANPITADDAFYGTATEGEIGIGTTAEYKAGTGYDLATGLGSVDANVLLSDWNKVTFNGTTTTLAASSNSFTHGTTITVSGTVSSSTTPVPTGSVALMTTSTLPANQGQTTFTLASGSYTGAINYLPGGTYNIYGHYGGDVSNAASSSNLVTLTVTPESSAIALEVLAYGANTVVANGGSVTYGDSINFEGLPAPTAQLTAYVNCVLYGATCPIFTSPTGTVAFTDSGTGIGTLALNLTGEADYAYSPAIGSHTVSAAYSGDASYGASTSTSTTFTVAKDTPLLSAATSNAFGLAGGPQVLTFTVANSIAYTAFPLAPSGTLAFTGGPTGMPAIGTLSAGFNSLANQQQGVVTVLLPASTPAGSYTVTYKYGGDTNYNATSSTFTFTIAATPNLLVSTISGSLSTTATPTAGAPVQLNVIVTGQTGHAAPTQFVLFYIDGNYDGYVNLPTVSSGDIATATYELQSQNLFTGSNTITMEYFGDTNYLPSEAIITVNSPLSDFAVTVAANVINAASSPNTDKINLSSLDSFAGAVTLTCTATTVTCSLSPSSVTLAAGGTGSSSLTVTSTGVAAGIYPVVVTATDSSGQYIHTATVTVVIPNTTADFQLSAASSTVTTSTTSTDAINLNAINSFAGTVALTCTPTTVTCSLSSTSVTLAVNGSGTSTLTVNATGVAAGSYPVVVSGIGASGTHSATITVVVPSTSPNSFTLSNGGAITIASQGASGKTSLSITPTGTFSGAVSLTCSVAANFQGASEIPTCSVTTPITVAMSAAASGTLTINTTAQTGALAVKPTTWLAATGCTLLTAMLTFLLLPSRHRRWKTLALMLTFALLAGGAIGCSNSSSASSGGGTPTGGTSLGSYTVTVTAVSGSITSSTTVNLTVN